MENDHSDIADFNTRKTEAKKQRRMSAMVTNAEVKSRSSSGDWRLQMKEFGT